MKRIILLIVLFGFLNEQSYSQIFDVNRNNFDKTHNTWAIGGGINNFIMHGDLRSIGTYDGTNYWNFGAYAYIDKMFNPILGVELKANYSKMSGGVQSFSEGYDLKYAPGNTFKEGMKFEGTSIGGELNLIISLTNIFLQNDTKWNASTYYGIGYHIYDSALFNQLDDGSYEVIKGADFGYNASRNSVNKASSIFLSAQLGVKRKISHRLDLEFRTGLYFNSEDHLDAAISSKQNWENFMISSLGIVFKIGNKNEHVLWDQINRRYISRDNDIRGNTNGASINVNNPVGLKIIDSDNDGVMDSLDVEPNTPPGVMVYGNGKAIDSDQDGLQDYKDKCPLVVGPISNNGCPLQIDSDGDGIMDDKDLCPNTPGIVENGGCPKQEVDLTSDINKQIELLAENIYFDTNSDRIKTISFSTIQKIITLMKQVPNVKFVIEGHTDSSNTDNYNLYLSQRRAASVKKYMINEGIDQQRLESIGYGESRPKFSNADANGRRLNRRVEVKPVGIIEK